SLVTVGAPKERSSTTLRPLGPRVTLTALARMFTPSTMRARASPPKTTSFAAISVLRIQFKDLFLNNRKQVVFLHDQQLLAVDLDGLAAVLAEQNAVADLDVHGDHITVVIALAGADGDDFTLVGLFGGVVRNDDAGG